MRLRIALVVAAAMLLSGCWWQGPAFYTGDPADAAPVAPGLYRADDLGDDAGAETVRVSWLPGGSVSVLPQDRKRKDSTDLSQATLHRFQVPGRDLWVVQYAIEKEPGTAVYGVIERRGDVLSVIPFLDCDATADIVRAAGGMVKAANLARDDPRNPPPGQTTNLVCSFADRSSFERALTDYIATDPSFPTRIALKRIGD